MATHSQSMDLFQVESVFVRFNAFNMFNSTSDGGCEQFRICVTSGKWHFTTMSRRSLGHRLGKEIRSEHVSTGLAIYSNLTDRLLSYN